MEAFWTRSGHVIVQPLIDGRAIGYMILDTGAMPVAFHTLLLPCQDAPVQPPCMPCAGRAGEAKQPGLEAA